MLGWKLPQTPKPGLGPPGEGIAGSQVPEVGRRKGVTGLDGHILLAPRNPGPVGWVWLEEGRNGPPQSAESGQGPSCVFISISTFPRELSHSLPPGRCRGHFPWICSPPGLSSYPSSHSLTSSSQKIRVPQIQAPLGRTAGAVRGNQAGD